MRRQMANTRRPRTAWLLPATTKELSNGSLTTSAFVAFARGCREAAPLRKALSVPSRAMADVAPVVVAAEAAEAAAVPAALASASCLPRTCTRTHASGRAPLSYFRSLRGVREQRRVAVHGACGAGAAGARVAAAADAVRTVGAEPFRGRRAAARVHGARGEAHQRRQPCTQARRHEGLCRVGARAALRKPAAGLPGLRPLQVQARDRGATPTGGRGPSSYFKRWRRRTGVDHEGRPEPRPRDRQRRPKHAARRCVLAGADGVSRAQAGAAASASQTIVCELFCSTPLWDGDVWCSKLPSHARTRLRRTIWLRTCACLPRRQCCWPAVQPHCRCAFTSPPRLTCEHARLSVAAPEPRARASGTLHALVRAACRLRYA